MLSHFLRCAAPITFITSAFTDSGGGAVTSLSMTVPSGKSGDMLIIVFGNNTGAIINVPSGWTAVTAMQDRARIIFKRTTADSESNVTVTVASSSVCGGVILRYRFVGKDPVAGTATNANVTSPATITANAVSGTVANDYVLQCFVAGASSRSFTQPSVSRGTVFAESDADQPSVAVFYQYSGSSNATSSPTGTGVITAVQVRLRK